MDHTLAVYLPADRRHALATGTLLPELTQGTALFADISGFTPLTEALTHELGVRRGAEELPRQLNLVYDALIQKVDHYGGSVIGFAGDAITCWFDQDLGLRATACGLAMQEAMRAFASIELPSGRTASLAMKVAVASGTVRRFLVGDPGVQLIDTLAGATLTRMAAAEQMAEKGEVVLDEQSAHTLGTVLDIQDWRTGERGARFAVVAGLRQTVPPQPWAPLAPGTLPLEQLRPWLLPTVYERLQAGQGEFLTELRPAVALFLRFSGIDYDADPTAGQKLDAFVRWVQSLLMPYEGTLLSLTMGDKGSYLYIAFGAPIAHEDDARRAALTALALRTPTSALSFIRQIQIGLSRGTMRTGAYGSSTHRTYGVLGDEVNLAARLMQHAQPGEIIVSGRVQEATASLFTWQSLPEIHVKGKRDPIPVFALLGEVQPRTVHLAEPSYALPMIGRQAELVTLTAKLMLVRQGHGQVVGITAEAGMGKSRLVAEAIRVAHRQGFTSYGGECQSYGTNTPYLVWQPIWRAIFGLEGTDTPERQVEQLARAVRELDPSLLPRLPLLAPILGLPLPDNDLIRAFSPELRKASREALLVDLLKGHVRALGPVLLVLEDCHWLDVASHDLLIAIGHAIWQEPVLLLLAYRPLELGLLAAPRVSTLPYFTILALTELDEPEMAHLIANRLTYLYPREGRQPPADLVTYLAARAQGNPFYLEELLNYLHDQGSDPYDAQTVTQMELPTSLHALILSRIDRLTETQKVTIKVASIIGRLFRLSWLLGYYPTLGEREHVQRTLDTLAHLDLTPLEQGEPELVYLFKHIVTREVAYESLPYGTRARLHEQLALFLEQQDPAAVEGYLDLLAHHYAQSENLAKKCHYLRRAGEAAQAAYASRAAQAYYEALLPLLQEPVAEVDLRLRLGEVLEWVGQWEAAQVHYQAALRLATTANLAVGQAQSALALGKLHRFWGQYEQAEVWFTQALVQWEALNSPGKASQALTELAGVALRQADYTRARPWLERSRSLCEAHNDQRGLAEVLSALGLLARGENDPGMAKALYQQSLALWHGLGDKWGMALCLSNLAYMATFQGSYAEAQTLFEQSLALRREIGDKRGMAWSLVRGGRLVVAQGNYAVGQARLDESLALFRQMGDKEGIAWALRGEAEIALSQGNYGQGLILIDESLALFRQMGNQRGMAWCLSLLGSLAWHEGEHEAFRRYIDESLALFRQMGDKEGIAWALMIEGVLALNAGELIGAQEQVVEGLALAREMGVKGAIIAALRWLGAISERQGDRKRAQQSYQEALRLALAIGAQEEVVVSLVGLAALTSREEPPESTYQATRLLAAAEAQRLTMGFKLDPLSQRLYDEALTRTRTALGEADAAIAWAQGQAMSLMEAAEVWSHSPSDEGGAMNPALLAYLPMDRRHALADGRALPEHMEGAALFADISGFTPLTEALTQALGARRGAEELSRHLNRVYDALTCEVHQYGGSVIGFAGDAITCWFDADPGERATACALAMQQAMVPFAEMTLPSGQVISLTVKVAVARGPVRRFLVGDPAIQRLEVLAGETLARLAAAEHLAQKGEVVLDNLTATHLGGRLSIQHWREQDATRIAVVAQFHHPVVPTPWPPLAPERLNEAELRPRLLPLVYERLQAGHGEFLTEVRPVVALFVRFSGLDYEGDPEAGRKLDRYIGAVQRIIALHGGTLIDITMDAKGSYLYAAFGAPVAHEDDALRAVSAALLLRQPLPDSGITSVQLGLSRGTMRAGAYGGTESRTYGALGDEVNLAARLMQRATPGEVLASGRIHEATKQRFHWQALDPVQVKGKAEPIPLFALVGELHKLPLYLAEPTYSLPMIGRRAELALLEEKLALVEQSQGQVVGILGEAGIGKSRLVAEAIRLAQRRGFTGYGGECHSYGSNIPYLLWQPIWRAFFGLAAADGPQAQGEQLARAVRELAPALLPRLPLLAALLDLPLEDNELTRAFTPELRKTSREALLVDLLKAHVRALGPVLLVLEDCHWLDAASHDLLQAIGYAIWNLPVLVLVTYRPPDLERLTAPRIETLPYFSQISLTELGEPEAVQVITQHLRQKYPHEARQPSATLIHHLIMHAQGNPFYLEELLNYLHDQELDPYGVQEMEQLELPASLHRLILSRIDRLTEPQKVTLKVASIIGRLFRLMWLVGYYPALGEPALVRANLELLARLDLTPLERAEPELVYFFKHIITREVLYESLPYATRTPLHGALAAFLEQQDPASIEGYLSLVTYHYALSGNPAKSREYLQRAGEAAQAIYANEAAIDYYERLLLLLTDTEDQGKILCRLGEVLELVGRGEEARRHYEQALALTEPIRESQPWAAVLWATCQRAIAGVLHKQGHYSEAREWLERARVAFEMQGNRAGLSQVLSEVGITFWNQGDYESATGPLLESVALARELGDSRSMGHALRQLGNIAFLRGEYPLARTRYEESVATARAAGDPLNMATALCNLGLVAHTYEVDFSRARHFYEESLALAQRIGDKNLISTLLVAEGTMLMEQGRHAEAEQLLREACTVVREMNNRRLLANALVNLGRNLCAQSEFEKAQIVLEEGMMLAQQIGVKWDVALGHANLAEIAYLQGELDRAQRHLEEGLGLAREINVKRTITNILSKLGLVSLARGESSMAKQYLEESLVVAQEIGRQQEVLQALSGLAGVVWQSRKEEGGGVQAVRLVSVVDSRLGALGMTLRPAHRLMQEQLVAATRAHLGEADFAAAWAVGQAMTLEEAVVEVLEKS